MILVDANLLIYAYIDKFPQHASAREWLAATLNGDTPVGLPWPSLLAFLRVTSNSQVVRLGSLTQAWQRVETLLNLPTVWVPEPTNRHRDTLAAMFGAVGYGGNLVPDAHLAALAIEHGLTLCSTDGDFARFPGLRWQNPIAR
jgi:toxin-antitoxin system PIN domain toxin